MVVKNATNCPPPDLGGKSYQVVTLKKESLEDIFGEGVLVESFNGSIEIRIPTGSTHLVSTNFDDRVRKSVSPVLLESLMIELERTTLNALIASAMR